MIDHISIKNFAIIENTEFDLEDGLNVITGETGAGKSIVIEAVSLALGSRADSSFVRHGEEKAYVELVASDRDEEYIISREISASGKNICKLNGHIATLAEIQDAARRIADIHGQYDNQLLLDQENQLLLVDSYQEDKISAIKTGFESSYDAYKKIKKEYDDLIDNARENEKKQDYYKYEIEEIDRISPKPGEDEELESRISILQNSETIYNALASSLEMLDGGDDSIDSGLSSIDQSLSSVRKYSKKLESISNDFRDAYYNIKSSTEDLRGILEMTDFSPEELDASISRSNDIDGLKKKYGGSIEAVLEQRDKVREDLDNIENFDERKNSLLADLNDARNDLKTKAERLTSARKASALILSKAIREEMDGLNFTGSNFSIEIDKAEAITRNGADQAEMMISTNPGEPEKPLSKIASGGELSRIMLAIKSVTGNHMSVPTMIFDEIDSGISGIAASAVARKLLKISRDHQIICITHLPQITAAAQHNYTIYKDNMNGNTFTHVRRLTSDEKEKEIARLLGGDNITETTITSARELINSYE